jgi:hypothetical protein
MNTESHPLAEMIKDTLKAANDQYLKGYRLGYEKGWEQACQAMLKQLEANTAMKGPT